MMEPRRRNWLLRMSPLLWCLAGISFAYSAWATTGPIKGYYRYPALHNNTVVFTAENDLWKVSAKGGVAQRLTTHAGTEMLPVFSPDGKWIAFTAFYDGDSDVYVISSLGGPAKRLTYRAGPELAVGWTRDSSSVIFRSLRNSGDRHWQLFKVGLKKTGLPTRLRLGFASSLSYSPDGKQVAFNRFSREFRTWKRYTGGRAQDIWLGSIKKQTFRRATRFPGTDAFPMWYKKRVYFLSDRTGIRNIFSLDPNQKTPAGLKKSIWQHTFHKRMDARWPSLSNGRVIYQRGADLWLLTLKTGKTHKLNITLPTDAVRRRKRTAPFRRYVQGYDLGPKGQRVLFISRGKLFNIPVKKGVRVQVTRSSSSRQRFATFSPDGKSMLAISDKSGEEQVTLFDALGRKAPKTLTKGKYGWLFRPTFSPDGKWFAVSDKNLNLWVFCAKSGKRFLVEKVKTWEIYTYRWSPDSRYLAYVKQESNDYNSIFIYDNKTRKSFRATRKWTNDYAPAWSADGKKLFFFSHRDINPFFSSFDFVDVIQESVKLYAIVLQKKDRSPFALRDNVVEKQAKCKKAKKAKCNKGKKAKCKGKKAKCNKGKKAGCNKAKKAKCKKAKKAGCKKAKKAGCKKAKKAGCNKAKKTKCNKAKKAKCKGKAKAAAKKAKAQPTTQKSKKAPCNKAKKVKCKGKKAKKAGCNKAKKAKCNKAKKAKCKGKKAKCNKAKAAGCKKGKQAKCNKGKKAKCKGKKAKCNKGKKAGCNKAKCKGKKAGKKKGKCKGRKCPRKVTVRIDKDGLLERVYQVPGVPAGNYYALSAVKGKLYMIRSGVYKMFRRGPIRRDLVTYHIKRKKLMPFARGVYSYSLSQNGKFLLYVQGGLRMRVVSTRAMKAPRGPKGMLKLHGLNVQIDPQKEWMQIFQEAWRLQRDFFWAPNMTKVDWKWVKKAYMPLVKRVLVRSDLRDLIGQIIGELGTSHTYVWGGDSKRFRGRLNGVLGANLLPDAKSGFYRFGKILRGAPWAQHDASPLHQHHLKIKKGTYLLAINGQKVKANQNVYRLLQDQGRQNIVLTVSQKPSLKGAKRVLVKATTWWHDRYLRYIDWVESRRKLTLKLSKGKVAYIHLPNMSAAGLVAFYRMWYPQLDKRAMVIDVRGNGGGFVSQLILQKLMRKLYAFFKARNSPKLFKSPGKTFHGHIAVVTNQSAGSDGDIFCKSFQALKLGKVFGMRTWGGVVGIRMNKRFVDWGAMTQPEYAWWTPTAKWSVENYGVKPDVVVENRPADIESGKDLQLKTTVNWLLKLLKKDPKTLPKIPPYTDKSVASFRNRWKAWQAKPAPVSAPKNNKKK